MFVVKTRDLLKSGMYFEIFAFNQWHSWGHRRPGRVHNLAPKVGI